MRKFSLIVLFLIGAGGCATAGVTITQPVTVNGVSSTTLVFSATAPADPPFQHALQLVNTNWLEIITPTNLLLIVYDSKASGTGNMPSNFNFTTSSGTGAVLPAANKFVVSWNSGAVTANVVSVDWKRATDYHLNETYLFRIRSELSLGITNAIPSEATVSVSNPDNTVFANLGYAFSSTQTSNRWNRAIHVTQLGFTPTGKKEFFVSRYEGTNVLETPFPLSSFAIYDVGGSTNIYTGTLEATQDLGSNYTSPPNQKVRRGDFTGVNKPGIYRVIIAGMGVSTDFLIDQSVNHTALKLYALGEFNQRCGKHIKGPPYSSWASGHCHTNANNFSIAVAAAGQSNHLHWATIASANAQDDGIWNTARLLTAGFSGLRPLFRWQGASTGLETSGGHHDAADYSKYTPNICMNLVNLIDAVDVCRNYSDDLGIPESGDGVPDLAQEAKVDADYLLKIADTTQNVATNAGVAFLVYPTDKTYENNPPDVPQQQILYPKTVQATCQAAAALYVMGTSPTVKTVWPDAATNYTAKAELMYGFVTNAIAAYGATNAMDIVYSYSTFIGAQDEYYSLYASRFLYTKNTNDLIIAKAWIPDPNDSSVKYFSWWPNYENVGVGSQALATSIMTGRAKVADFGAEITVFAAATNSIHQDALRQVQMCDSNAFHYPYEFESKRVNTTPYSFSGRTAKMLAVDSFLQLFHSGSYNPTNVWYMQACQNWDLGGNIGNSSRVYGFGLKPPRTSVDQWGRFTNRQENGPTGVMKASLNQDDNGSVYVSESREIAWPKWQGGGIDTQFPVMERTDDLYYLGGERTVDVMGMTVLQRAALDVLSRTNMDIPPKPVIIFPSTPQVGVSQTVTAFVPGIDTSLARHTWWVSTDQQRVTRQLTYKPASTASTNWTVEILLPNGAFYSTTTNVTVTP